MAKNSANIEVQNFDFQLFIDRSEEKVQILNVYTVKPVYNDHPWDPQKVVVVRRWSLLGGSK